MQDDDDVVDSNGYLVEDMDDDPDEDPPDFIIGCPGKDTDEILEETRQMLEKMEQQRAAADAANKQ